MRNGCSGLIFWKSHAPDKSITNAKERWRCLAGHKCTGTYNHIHLGIASEAFRSWEHRQTFNCHKYTPHTYRHLVKSSRCCGAARDNDDISMAYYPLEIDFVIEKRGTEEEVEETGMKGLEEQKIHPIERG